jgi:hypothetical protein
MKTFLARPTMTPRPDYVAAVLLALFLGGCAAQNKATWQKPGASAAQREQDAMQCKYEADKALASAPRCALCEIGSNDVIVDAVAGSPSSKLVGQCMALRGYTPA